MGFQGYPVITIAYHGSSADIANTVEIQLVLEEGAEALIERFTSKLDAREDETIQSAIVKMIERSEANTVVVSEGIVSA